MIQQQVQQVVVLEGDLVAHDEGLAPWFWDRSRKTSSAQAVLHIALLVCLIVGVDEGHVFAVEVLYAIIHHIHQGCLLLVLSIQPKGVS